MTKTSRILALLVLIAFIPAGCTHERKSKEQLLSESVKLIQDARPGEAFVILRRILDKDPNYFEARLQLAKTYSLLGNFSAAETELEKVRRQNPSSREVTIETARVLAATGKTDQALQELAPYLGEASPDCDALQIAGAAQAEKVDYAASVALISKAVQVCGPGSSASSLLLARVYALSGNPQGAEDQIRQVIAAHPDNRSALYMLAQMQLARKDQAAAIRTFDQILEKRPGDGEAQYRKGLLYLDAGEYDKALTLGQDMTKQVPESPEGQRLLGFAYFYKKQYADALAPLQKSVIKQPHPVAYYILGLTHLARNESEQGMNQIQKALDLQPSFAAARLQLAQMLLSQKRIDDAIQEAKKTLAAVPDNAAAHNILGSAYLGKGEYEDGVAELNKALALDPSLADAHWKKGLVAIKRGIAQEAESELAAVVDLQPDAQNIRRILALQCLNRNEPGKAIETLQKGKQSPDAVSCFMIGEAYLRQKKENEAASWYQKAKEADPKFAAAYQRMASLFFAHQKQEQAVQELRSLLDHAPDNVQALLLLASLDEINGKQSSARDLFLKASATGRTEGVVGAAYYLARTNSPASALSAVNEAIGRAGNNADTALYELKGKLLSADRKYQEALAAFEAVERRNPLLGFGYIANTYLAMGEPGKALEKVRAEIAKNPGAVALQAELSRIQLQAGSREEAMETARDIIRREPRSPVGYLALAAIHQSGKNLDKAIEVLKNAPGSDERVSLTLSSLYAAQRKYSLALQYASKVQNSKTEAGRALFQKAVILHAMGKKKEAAAEYEKVVRLSPNGLAFNNLACLYLEQNRNLPQALLLATRALILMPGNDVVRDTLGSVLVKTGRVAEGIAMLEKVSENNPKNGTTYYHLAIAYQESGRTDKAVESLQKALALNDFPESKDAAALLNKIRKARI